MSTSAGREKLKQDGVNIADWLTALALFTGHAAKVRLSLLRCALCGSMLMGVVKAVMFCACVENGPGAFTPHPTSPGLQPWPTPAEGFSNRYASDTLEVSAVGVHRQ
jgi:hypothetical protein